MKICITCKQEKSDDEFYNGRTDCKICAKQKSAAYFLANRDKILEKWRSARFKEYLRLAAQKMKRCRLCKRVKAYSRFPKYKPSKDELYSYCKKCSVKEHQKYYWKNHKQCLQRARDYGRQPEIVKKGREWRNKHRKKIRKLNSIWQKKHYTNPNNKIKRQASAFVNDRVRRNKIDPPSVYPCFYIGCDKSAKHFHHYSYDPRFWLVVIPLCMLHHHMIHRKDAIPSRDRAGTE